VKIVLDTNLYVSAFQFGGKPMQLLQKGIDGDIDIAVSTPIIQETVRVLRDKFGWSGEQLAEALSVIAAATYEVTITEALDVVERDPSDNRILEAAVAAGAEVVVSGDSDLLSMEVFRNIEIRRLSDFLILYPDVQR
jgi:putative PIN family toxin of toxin-antitoxin system